MAPSLIQRVRFTGGRGPWFPTVRTGGNRPDLLERDRGQGGLRERMRSGCPRVWRLGGANNAPDTRSRRINTPPGEAGRATCSAGLYSRRGAYVQRRLGRLLHDLVGTEEE
jgi:hypothetical protein